MINSLSFLKNHPFAVQAHFERSLVLTFALPKEDLEAFIPESLTLDTFQDKWAFLAIAMVQTKSLRPKGMPKFLGNDFFLIGYRIFVKYQTSFGKRYRGLYIIKSQTNKKKMEILGNFFTHYNYTTTDIKIKTNEAEAVNIESNESRFSLTYAESDEAPLPPNSPFNSWKEARRYAGPLPFTFTYNDDKKEMLIIEGVRQQWQPKAINIIDCQFPLLDEIGLGNAVLANAFIIKDIPYYWKKGRKDKWTP